MRAVLNTSFQTDETRCGRRSTAGRQPERRRRSGGSRGGLPQAASGHAELACGVPAPLGAPAKFSPILFAIFPPWQQQSPARFWEA